MATKGEVSEIQKGWHQQSRGLWPMLALAKARSHRWREVSEASVSGTRALKARYISKDVNGLQSKPEMQNAKAPNCAAI